MIRAGFRPDLRIVAVFEPGRHVLVGSPALASPPHLGKQKGPAEAGLDSAQFVAIAFRFGGGHPPQRCAAELVSDGIYMPGDMVTSQPSTTYLPRGAESGRGRCTSCQRIRWNNLSRISPPFVYPTEKYDYC